MGDLIIFGWGFAAGYWHWTLIRAWMARRAPVAPIGPLYDVRASIQKVIRHERFVGSGFVTSLTSTITTDRGSFKVTVERAE